MAFQSRGVTEPQREGGPLAVDEVFPPAGDSCPPCLKGDVSEADRGIPPAAAASHKGGEENAFVIGSELDEAKKIARLPTSMQARYNDLPKTAQRALIK